MEVSLRKAKTLSDALIAKARALPLTRSITVSIYGKDTVQNEVEFAQNRLVANIKKSSELLGAGYGLRAQIGSVNAARVSPLLTEKASIEANEKMLATLASDPSMNRFGEAVDAIDIAQTKLDALKVRASAPDARSYGQAETISVDILSESLAETINKSLVAIRRRKVEISDELLQVNMTTKVKISADAEALLREFDLI